MIGKIFATLLLSTLTFGAASAAGETVVYNSSPNSQARQIVNIVFAEYLQQRVGGIVETAVMDLDDDKTGEIFARFVHTGSCTEGMKECRTVAIKYEGGKWNIILDRPTSKIEVFKNVKRSPLSPSGGPANLKLDKFVWTWSDGGYAPTLDGIEGKLSFRELPSSNVAAIAPAFGQGASKLVQAEQPISFEFAKPAVTTKSEVLLVRMKGKSVCGYVAGCPIRMLQKNGEKWSPVLSAQTDGDILISDASRGGYRDLIMKTDSGVAVLGWNGSSYTIADRLEKAGK